MLCSQYSPGPNSGEASTKQEKKKLDTAVLCRCREYPSTRNPAAVNGSDCSRIPGVRGPYIYIHLYKRYILLLLYR